MLACHWLAVKLCAQGAAFLSLRMGGSGLGMRSGTSMAKGTWGLSASIRALQGPLTELLAYHWVKDVPCRAVPCHGVCATPELGGHGRAYPA